MAMIPGETALLIYTAGYVHEHAKQKHLVLTRNIGAQKFKLATIAKQAPDKLINCYIIKHK